MIYNYIYPDTTIKNAGIVAMGASNILNRASTLANFGYGEDLQSSLENHEKVRWRTTSKTRSQMIHEVVTPIYEVALLIHEVITPMVKHGRSPI